MTGGKRTINLDRHTELKLAAGYAEKLAKNPDLPDMPAGAAKHARELVNYSYGHQIITNAYTESLPLLSRLGEEICANNKRVSGHVDSAVAHIDEMFQNYDRIELRERKDIGTLKSSFEKIKEKAVRLARDYDDALGRDVVKVSEYGQKLSEITTAALFTVGSDKVESLWDVAVCLAHSVDGLMFTDFEDGTSKGALYESFVDSIISALIREGARQVSER